MHLTDDELVLHYYGEMADAEEARAEAHLGACGACQQNYARLQRVMAFVDSAPAVEPAPGFERIAWARLRAGAAASRRGGWFSWFVFSPARLAFAAGVRPADRRGRSWPDGCCRATAGPGGAGAGGADARRRCASGSCSSISASTSIDRRWCWWSS